jgi:hypothetical protein
MKDNGTLLFCTSYFRDAVEWRERYLRWINHHKAFPWLYRAMVMIDDGSPYEPDQSQAMPLAAADIGKRELQQFALIRFPNNLGRSGITDYPGWCRSFLFSLDIAEIYGFRKIVHVESDTYLLSRAIGDYIERAERGWTAFWSARYGFPETALQIICSDAYPAFGRLRDAGLEAFQGRAAEIVLPFTNVEKAFVGDRFSEFQATIPLNADYAVQVLPTMFAWKPHSLWYRVRRLFSGVPRAPVKAVRGPRLPDAEAVAHMPDAEAKEWAFKAGLRAYEQGYFQAARRCLERAGSVQPEDARVRALLAACCWKCGDLRAALAEGSASLEIEPNDAQTQCLVGDIRASMGSLEAAIDQYLNALRIDPTELRPLRSIRELEGALKNGGAVGDRAEDHARASLMERLKLGSLDERGHRSLLLVRKRTREGLRELLPIATAVAAYRTLDTDEAVALAEIFDAAGDSRRRDEYLAMLPPAAREALNKTMKRLHASSRMGKKT